MKFLYMFSLSLFSMIASCGNLNNSKFANTNTLNILSGTYHITAISEFDTLPKNLTITFDTITNRVSGFSGCNRFFGTYQIENNSIKFSKIGATRMFCEPDANQVENQMLRVLEDVNSFSLENKVLKLYSDKNSLLGAVQKQNKDISASIEYFASSRRHYKFISVNKKTILLSTKKDTEPITEDCNKEVWNSITSVLKSVDIENIPNLEPPSKNHQFDGASMAKLKITLKGKTYETQAFDHGNPPKEITRLIKEILSISENIE